MIRHDGTAGPAPTSKLSPVDVRLGERPLQGNECFGLEGREPLQIVRDVPDADDWISPGHKKDWQPGALPESLREALMCFVLTCAARAARGQTNTHNSMLVHVTRFQAVQALVAEQIQDEEEQKKAEKGSAATQESTGRQAGPDAKAS